jgi:cytoskeleton protein RodZ
VSGFGDRLRREREMRGVSLDEIAESTKIGTRSLRALEEDDFDKLPGGIFNKGFVRAYSRFLGLDEEQTVADFDAAWKEYEAARRPVATPEPAEESSGDSRLTWLMLAALVLVVLLAAAWYFVKRHNKSASREAIALPSPAINNSQPLVPAPTNTSAPSSLENAAPSSPAPVPSASETKWPAPEGAPKSASQPDSTISQRSQLAKAAVTQPDLNAPIQLEVFAREDSWLSVSADGKNLGQGVLTAQKSRTIRAQKEVRLKLGNVGGVEVSFNGRPVNIDGEPKQVKELTFTPEGLRQ